MRATIAALAALLALSPAAASSETEGGPGPSQGEDEREDPGRTDGDLKERVRHLEEELRQLRALLGDMAGGGPGAEAGAESAQAEAADLSSIEAALQADAEAAAEAGGQDRDDGGAPTGGAVRTYASNPQGLNPDISFIADVALAWFTSDEPLQAGGHDPNRNGFNLQQLELAVGKTVDPYFRFDGNIVFSQFGVEIEEVYATTLGLPLGMQVRAGQFLTRFGRINNTHPHTWDFVDQAFAVGRVFGGEGNRGLGVEGSILMPFPWYFEVVASETMANGESTARSFFGARDLGVGTPADFQTTVAAKQFFPLGPDFSLNWGLSWASGPNPTGRRNRTEVYGSDLYLKWRPISRGGFRFATLQAEVFWRRQQVPGDVLQDVGVYAQVLGRFALRWGTAWRYEYGSPTTDLAGDRVPDPQDPSFTAARHRITGNVSFWPTEFSRMRLQAGSDLPRWREKPDWSVMLAFEFAVGAHGAHAF